MKEIVIELNDTTYESLTSPSVVIDFAIIRNLIEAIVDGKVLPKGHDRLIEAQKAQAYLYRNMEWYDENGFIADDEEKNKALQDLVDGMPTFIEADKGEIDGNK